METGRRGKAPGTSHLKKVLGDATCLVFPCIDEKGDEEGVLGTITRRSNYGHICT